MFSDNAFFLCTGWVIKIEYGFKQIAEPLRERVEPLPSCINKVKTSNPQFATYMAFVFFFIYSIHNPGIESDLSGFFGRIHIITKLVLRVTDQK